MTERKILCPGCALTPLIGRHYLHLGIQPRPELSVKDEEPATPESAKKRRGRPSKST